METHIPIMKNPIVNFHTKFSNKKNRTKFNDFCFVGPKMTKHKTCTHGNTHSNYEKPNCLIFKLNSVTKKIALNSMTFALWVQKWQNAKHAHDLIESKSHENPSLIVPKMDAHPVGPRSVRVGVCDPIPTNKTNKQQNTHTHTHTHIS
jgi:hypothetical protein